MSNDFWSSIGTEATFITPTEKEGSNSLLSERFRTVSALNPRFAAEYKEECPVCGNDEGFVEKSDGDVCCPNCGTSVFEVPDFGDGDPNLSFAGSRRTAATISDMYDSIDEYDPDHIAICYVCDEHFLLGDAERDGNDFMCPNCESSDISVGYTSVSDWSAQQAERQQLGLTGSRRTAIENMDGRYGQRKRASLFDDANAAYRRRDQGWFNSLSMDDLLTLWKAVSGENFITGLQTYAWDDEVYDALYDKGYDFDANRRTTASRRTVAADDGGIYCSKCKGRQVVNMGGVWRNCTKCKGSGLNKKRIPKDVMDIIGEGSLHSVTKRRTAAMIQENQYVRVVKPFDLVAYKPDKFGLTLVSRTTKPGEVLLYLGERPGPGSDSVPMYAVRGLTDQIWFEQGWAPRFLNPDNGFVEVIDIGRYASRRVADMSVGFQCLECGAKFKNPKRKCSKCGSYDIDLDPNYKAKSASQVTTAAGDKRRGRGRRKFVPRPSDKHPFDNEPDDYLDTIEDRYGSRAPQGSGRRVAARFVIVENESGKRTQKDRANQWRD